MILAPSEERTADGYDYRVLLLKRNAKSSTFVSAHVFPGPSFLVNEEKGN
jgi:nucleoside diphosphate-linked moiety X motif protein 19